MAFSSPAAVLLIIIFYCNWSAPPKMVVQNFSCVEVSAALGFLVLMNLTPAFQIDLATLIDVICGRPRDLVFKQSECNPNEV
jgi:hypothetical protein